MKTNQKQGDDYTVLQIFIIFQRKTAFSPFVTFLPLCLEYRFEEYFTSLVRKFDVFLTSRMFITTVTRTRQWYLWPAEPEKSSTCSFFLKDFMTEFTCIPAICSKCRPTTHLMLVDFISVLIFEKEC